MKHKSEKEFKIFKNERFWKISRWKRVSYAIKFWQGFFATVFCHRYLAKNFPESFPQSFTVVLPQSFTQILEFSTKKFLNDIYRSCRRKFELTKNIEIQSWYYFVTTCMITTSFIHIFIFFFKFISPQVTLKMTFFDLRWLQSKWLKVHQWYLVRQFSIKLAIFDHQNVIKCCSKIGFFHKKCNFGQNIHYQYRNGFPLSI